ncbi:hypothetical protein D9M68_821110 [compost metagenome]
MRDGFVGLGRGRQLQVVRIRLLAEIRGLEELLDQDDLGALGGRLAHQFLGVGDIRGAIPGAGHLGGGDGNDAGHGDTSSDEFGPIAGYLSAIGIFPCWRDAGRRADGDFISDKNLYLKRDFSIRR